MMLVSTGVVQENWY